MKLQIKQTLKDIFKQENYCKYLVFLHYYQVLEELFQTQIICPSDGKFTQLHQ